MEKFKVGKWYKNLGSLRSWYAKATDKSKMTEGYKFWHAEYINDKGKYKKNSSNSWLDWTDSVRECDLSEIQQYLPDGHPDKIKEESRSWCVNVTKENREVVKKWMDNKDYGITTGSYYGIRKSDYKKFGNMSEHHFDKIISTEEFYSKIGHKERDNELLEKAKRKYPVGTKFNSLGGHKNVKVTNSYEYHPNENIRTIVNNGGILYSANTKQWAEIISNECPYKHRFGKDVDSYDDCDNCNKWDACIDEKDGININKTSINKSKNRNNEGQSIKIKRIVSNVSRGDRPRGTGFFNRRSVTASRCGHNSYEKRAIDC